MKNMKQLVFLMLACIAVALSGYKNEDGFTIRGKITGAKDGSKIAWRYADIRSGNDQVGTAVITNGEFEFKGKLASPRLLSMNLKGVNGTVGTCFFAENADITVEASVDDLLDWSTVSGSGSSAKVRITGSKSQDLYGEYRQKTEAFDKQISLLSGENLVELYKEKGSGRPEPKMPIAFGIKISKQIDALVKARRTFTTDFILKNKPSEPLSYIASGTLANDISVPEIDQLVKYISSSIEKGPLTEHFLQAASRARKSAVGASFADFTLNDPQGASHKLS